jgi:hypothetical protein
MQLIINKVNPITRIIVNIRSKLNTILKVPNRTKVVKISNSNVITVTNYYKDKQIIKVFAP